MKTGRTSVRPEESRSGRQRPGPTRRRQDPGAVRRAPQTAPMARPAERPGRAKNADQAKARAKARKAKAPKVVRPPLRQRIRERLINRLAGLDLRPRALLARIPFVVLVIGALGIGLAITLWLSTDAAGRSYQLGSARALNEALTQQKEALERDVLQAQSAPALADAARNLGMIPSRDTAHLVQDPVGNWVVVGQPKPAIGVPPPPLNTKLPDPTPPPPPTPAPRPLPPAGAEVPTRITTPLVIPGAIPPATIPPAIIPSGPTATPGLVLVPVPLPAGAAAPVPADPFPAPPPVPVAAPVPGAGQ